MTRRLAVALLAVLAATLGLLTWYSRREKGGGADRRPAPSSAISRPAPIASSATAVPPSSSLAAPPGSSAALPGSSAAPPPPDWPKQEVAVWFEGEDEKLHRELRSEPVPPGSTGKLRAALSALFAGPAREDLSANWPPGGSVRAIFLAPPGVVTVDLDLPPENLEGWGAHSEWMALQSLVATVIGLVPEAGGVVLTIRGESPDTLAGHVDLGRPLRPVPALLVFDEPAAGSSSVAPPATGSAVPRPPVSAAPRPPSPPPADDRAHRVSEEP